MSSARTSDATAAFVAKMSAAGQPPVAIDAFVHYYRKVIDGETGLIHDRDIRPVSADEIAEFDRLGEFEAAGRRALRHSVHIVLNGGLGTSMGLTGPKSLIPVRDSLSFLEIILRQSRDGGVRLAFMNSFNTHAATQQALNALMPDKPPLLFLQHKFPKILRSDLSPANWPPNPELEWNPPGHGDVFLALAASGLLDALLADGFLYAFIANCDNLGARLNPALLGYFTDRDLPFMMEVAEKTPADIKGGHLARRRDGRLILREAAQCPKGEIDAFRDIRRYRYFNTNNIWIRLEEIRRLVARHGVIDLPLILNPKTLDPRDSGSPPVFQVECAMGAAISLFEGASAVNVPRSRFFPVKTCSDLLAVRSDYFEYTADQGLRIHPQRDGNDVLRISLDPRFYKSIDQLERRFPAGPPSLLGCKALKVEGDVVFEEKVTIQGAVKITNLAAKAAVVPAGTLIRQDLTLG